MLNEVCKLNKPSNKHTFYYWFSLIFVSLFTLTLIFLNFNLNWDYSGVPLAQAQTTITINANTQYQTIEGFGGHVDSRIGSIGWGQLVDELGITIVRIGFPAGIEAQNDNNDPFNTDMSKFDIHAEAYNPNGKLIGEASNDVDVLRSLANAGIDKFMMSGWAYPAWLAGGWTNGNRITDADEFGELAATTIKLYRNYGIPVTHFSIYNEPNIFWSGGTSGRHVSDLVISLRQRLDHEGLQDVKILAPEDSGLSATDMHGNPWIYPDAYSSLDVFPYHTYDQIWFAASNDYSYSDIKNFTSQTGIATWQTEACNYIYGGGDISRADTFEEGLYTGVHIHDDLTRGNSTAWLWWILYCYSTEGRGQGQRLIDTGTGPSPKFYAMKQFSKYIKPGSIRIDVQGGEWDIHTSAYLHPDDTFTMVVVNLGSGRTYNFNLLGLGINSLERYRYADGENTQPIGAISVTNNSFSDHIKADSITTYTAQASSQPPTHRPHLTLSKSSNLSTVSQGQEIRYTIHYQNTGQATAQNVVITDHIPPNTSYIQGSANPPASLSAGVLSWSLGSLNTGQQGNLEFRVRVD